MRRSFTDEEADKIRALYQGGYSLLELARLYSVANSTMENVVFNLGSYRHRQPSLPKIGSKEESK
jgi:hypothetical protein